MSPHANSMLRCFQHLSLCIRLSLGFHFLWRGDVKQFAGRLKLVVKLQDERAERKF